MPNTIFRQRRGPLLIAFGLLGGLLYTTYGGRQQPRPRAMHDATSQVPVSETLQTIAGTGGERARSGDDMESLKQYDTKDTRLHSGDPAAQSKRNPQKVRGDLGGDETTPGGGGQGKHIGERDTEKGGDLPWKKINP